MHRHLILLLLALCHMQLGAQQVQFENSVFFLSDLTRTEITMQDVNNDHRPDMLVIGEKSFDEVINLYLNMGDGLFQVASNEDFTWVEESAVAFGDIDNDGDLDMILTGEISLFDSFTKLYLNDGSGNFTEQNEITLERIRNGAVGFSDFDLDGNMDILIAGEGDGLFDDRIILYENDGEGGFKEVDTPFEPLEDVVFQIADLDNDGDQDIFILGNHAPFEPVTDIYRNIGSMNFEKELDSGIELVQNGDFKLGDVDGDLDLDLVIMGFMDQNNNWPLKGAVYLNNGNGKFAISSEPFKEVARPSIVMGDVDRDMDLDVVITGRTGEESGGDTKVYLNDGSGEFSEISNLPFENSWYDQLVINDLDDDGDLDLLMSNYAGISFFKNTTPCPEGMVSGAIKIEELKIQAVMEDATYQWLDCNNGMMPISGETSRHLTPTKNGTYAVQVSKNGCTAISDCVEVLIASSKKSVNDLLSVSPNPTTGIVNLHFKNNSTRILNLYDFSGKLIMPHQEVVTENYIFSLPLPTGLYLLEVHSEDTMSIVRLIKN